MSARFTDVKFATFNARNAVNDVGGGACKIVTNNEIGFRCGNNAYNNEHVSKKKYPLVTVDFV